MKIYSNSVLGNQISSENIDTVLNEQCSISTRGIDGQDIPIRRSNLQIGALYSKLIQLNPEVDRELYRQIFERLGIDKTDEITQRRFHSIITRINNLQQEGKLKISRALNSDRVFQISEDDTPIAFFKAGRKRCMLEQLQWRIASHLGLEGQITPSCFAALSIDPEEDEAVFNSPDGPFVADEELWNGKQLAMKQPGYVSLVEPYENLQFKTCLVGSIVPYIPEEQITRLAFAKMAMLAALLGMRDGKDENVRSGIIIDAEQALPPENDPIAPRGTPEQTPDMAEYHQNRIPRLCIPFMNNTISDDPLNDEEIEILSKLVQSWSAVGLFRQLNAVPIRYEDTVAEVNDKDFFNEAGMSSSVERYPPSLHSRIIREVPASFIPIPDDRMNALLERMNRIQDLFRQYRQLSYNLEITLTPFDIVCSADPHWGALDYERRLSERMGNPVPEEYVTGCFTPHRSPTPLSQASINWLRDPQRTSTPRWPLPSPTNFSETPPDS